MFRSIVIRGNHGMPDYRFLVDTLSPSTAISRAWKFISGLHRSIYSFELKSNFSVIHWGLTFKLVDFPLGNVYRATIQSRDLCGIDSFDYVYFYATDQDACLQFIENNFFDGEVFRFEKLNYSYIL